MVHVLGWLMMVCLLPAIFLGLSKTGEPLWSEARLLFGVAGVLAILQACLRDGRRGVPMVAIPAGV